MTNAQQVLNVKEGMFVSSAEVQKGSHPAVDAQRAGLVPVGYLNKPYWKLMLPLVYNKAKADSILSQLCEGVYIGRPNVSGGLVSNNWPSAMEFATEVTEVIENDVQMGFPQVRRI